MKKEYVDITVKGRAARVPSVCIKDRRVIASGGWLRTAEVMDEELLEGETVQDPNRFLAELRDAPLKADIFTFAQKLPDTAPKYAYHLEFDSAAVVPIISFSDWWENRAEYDVRKAVKRAKRLGVDVRLSEFTDEFVKGICNIYNESSVRQGKSFWHYQKAFDNVKRENSTYLERSLFIGAYFEQELIGFIKMVRVGTTATTLQVISQKRHFDKKPTNALIAKAVEICAQNGVSHLIYGNYVYSDPKSSLTEFKRRNGFAEVLLPRYYVPLTVKGRFALHLKLHRQLVSRIPAPLLARIRSVRTLWYSRRVKLGTAAS